jgi:hypothetical protein
MLTWERCRNFKSLPFCSQTMNPRNFFTERVRRSRQEAPQQESPITGNQNFSSVTPYTKKVKIPEFQISPVLRTLNMSGLGQDNGMLHFGAFWDKSIGGAVSRCCIQYVQPGYCVGLPYTSTGVANSAMCREFHISWGNTRWSPLLRRYTDAI